MSSVNSKGLKDHQAEQGERAIVIRAGDSVVALVPISQIKEADEEALLADMACRGLGRLPTHPRQTAIPKKGIPVRGVSMAALVIADRR